MDAKSGKREMACGVAAFNASLVLYGIYMMNREALEFGTTMLPYTVALLAGAFGFAAIKQLK